MLYAAIIGKDESHNITQQSQNAKTTSYERRCIDVHMTLF